MDGPIVPVSSAVIQNILHHRLDASVVGKRGKQALTHTLLPSRDILSRACPSCWQIRERITASQPSRACPLALQRMRPCRPFAAVRAQLCLYSLPSHDRGSNRVDMSSPSAWDKETTSAPAWIPCASALPLPISTDGVRLSGWLWWTLWNTPALLAGQAGDAEICQGDGSM